MFVSLWLNTVTSSSNVFYRAYFCFFMTLFLRKMGMILSARKPHYHSELSKPILKIQSICRKKYFRVNNFLKQYALDTFSDFFMHQNFKYFLQNQISWSKLSNCSQAFYEQDALMNFI